jgi:hypothetical protein
MRGGVDQMWILKNSKDLFEYIQSRSLSSCKSIKHLTSLPFTRAILYICAREINVVFVSTILLLCCFFFTRNSNSIRIGCTCERSIIFWNCSDSVVWFFVLFLCTLN